MAGEFEEQVETGREVKAQGILLTDRCSLSGQSRHLSPIPRKAHAAHHIGASETFAPDTAPHVYFYSPFLDAGCKEPWGRSLPFCTPGLSHTPTFPLLRRGHSGTCTSSAGAVAETKTWKLRLLDSSPRSVQEMKRPSASPVDSLGLSFLFVVVAGKCHDASVSRERHHFPTP